MFPVKGVPLGKYLLKYPNTNVAVLINKTSDTAEVRRIKQVIAAMLAPSAKDRSIMQEVVDQLSEIHVSLCMKLLLSYNTAWKSQVLYSKSNVFTYAYE